jgi:hypothetical protein
VTDDLIFLLLHVIVTTVCTDEKEATESYRKLQKAIEATESYRKLQQTTESYRKAATRRMFKAASH